MSELTEPDDMASLKKHLGSRAIPTVAPAGASKATTPRASPRLAAAAIEKATPGGNENDQGMNARQRRDAARAAKRKEAEERAAAPAHAEESSASQNDPYAGMNARQKRDAKRAAKHAEKAEKEGTRELIGGSS